MGDVTYIGYEEVTPDEVHVWLALIMKRVARATFGIALCMFLAGLIFGWLGLTEFSGYVFGLWLTIIVIRIAWWGLWQLPAMALAKWINTRRAKQLNVREAKK